MFHCNNGASLSRSVGLVLISAWLLTGCPSKGADPAVTQPVAGAEDNTRDPQWVSQHTPRAQVAVVFVHGIFGDTLGTWTHSQDTSFFQLLNSDPQLEGQVDMYAFGYTSKMLGEGSFTIDEAARRLRDRLKYNGVLDYPAIVFVAHSMGGLVTLRTLLTYREEILPRVPLIALYATPQEGSQIADIGRYISPNPALQQMIPGDSNRYLEALDNDWKEANREKPIPVVCAYETRSTYKIKIVPRGSATRYCTEPSSAIDADHITISKPDRAGHDSIVILVNALNRYVVGKQWSAKMELPDFTRDGDKWLFTLVNDYGKQHARLVNAGRMPLRYTIAELTDPGLLVWPDDTPREVPGEREDRLGFALGSKATKADYEFTLRADGTPDQRVHVHVPDLPAQIRQQQMLVGNVVAEFNAWLADPGNRRNLAQAAPDDPAVADTAIEQARRAVAAVMPDAPASIQWVVAADALNSANWSTLAVAALRKAEESSSTVTLQPAVLRTAAWVAASSGETQLFQKTGTPIVPDAWKIPVGTGLPEGVDLNVATELATRCQGIPALQGPCFSLKGDVAEKMGDSVAAKAALEESARIRMTPSVSERLRRQTTTQPSRGVGAAASHLSVAPAAAPSRARAGAVILNHDAVVVAPTNQP